MRLFPEAYFIPAYELLKSKEIPQWDFHIHADYSDGKATIPQIFGEAIKQELEVIVLTEHTESWRTDKIGWFKCYVDEIEKNRAIHQNEISAFIGVEANALSFDGDVELTDEMRKDAEFVLGAAHRYPGLEGRRVFELNHTEAVDLEFKTLLGLAGSNEIDAIAHIGATCAKYGAVFPMSLSREIIRAATKNDVAVEINPAYHKPLLGFLEVCAEENAKICMGSNAHSLNDVGSIGRVLKRIFQE